MVKTNVQLNMLSNRSLERKEFLSGAIDIALFGGINYWAFSKDVTRTEEGLVTAMIQENDDMTVPFQKLDINLVAKGISKIKSGTVSINPDLKKIILLGNKENDACYIGSDEADAIVQIGMFGKLVYG